jgi:hypothetical protein
MNEKEKDELLLTQVVLMFQAAALQQMGKLKNPVTDRVERQLDQARISIDILDVLHRKMKPGLSAEEEKMFSTVLRDLQLNFVDESSRGADPGAAAGGADSGSPEGKTE